MPEECFKRRQAVLAFFSAIINQPGFNRAITQAGDEYLPVGREGCIPEGFPRGGKLFDLFFLQGVINPDVTIESRGSEQFFIGRLGQAGTCIAAALECIRRFAAQFASGVIHACLNIPNSQCGVPGGRGKPRVFAEE